MTGQTVHPMRQALDDGHILTGVCLAAALILLLALTGMHGSDVLAAGIAVLFLASPEPWRRR